MARFFIGYLLGLFVRLWSASWRARVYFEDEALLAHSEPLIYVFWHGSQMSLTRARRRRATSALVSLSKDGALQSGVLSALGLCIVRGSSSRQGANGLKAVVRRLRSGQDAAFAVDGPRGPRARAKAGAEIAARLAHGLCVPLGCAAERAFVLRKSWDRFMIPLPFTRVVIWVGAPLRAGTAPASGSSAPPLASAIDRANLLAARTLSSHRSSSDPAAETCRLS